MRAQVRCRKLTLAQAQKALPIRGKTDNKSVGGRCLVIAGSKNMWGAGVLTATAVARVGAGYVYLFKQKGKFPIQKHPDFLFEDKISQLSKFSAVAIGPGFSNNSKIKQILQRLRSQHIENVVLDAEAINTLSTFKKLPKLPETWVVTPHEGELARLIKVSSGQIKENRIKYALLAQKTLGCIIVLKGHRTLIATPKTLWENPSGNSSLAKAGTGDVLTGIIAGFLSQKLRPEMAAVLGCYIHGFLADHWVAQKKDPLSLMASDLLEDLPKILNLVRTKTFSTRSKK